MSSLQKFGAFAVACLFAAAMAAPVDAQHRQKSGSSVSSGAKAAPRGGGGGGQSAGPRSSPQGSGQSAGARQPQGPRPSPGAGPGARPRPAGTPATGRAVPRPPYHNGSGGYYPGYGHGGHYPYYGYRPYYPYYGYGGYYGYYPGFYWGVGAYFGPYYYSPWLYSSWYYPYDYYYYDYGPGGASLKVEVQPKTAEVYVDGYLAGIVDQFDGMFQSLSVEPGEHEITVYQEGFRSIRQRLYLSAGSTIRIKGALEKLAPGEPNEPRPQRAYEPAPDAQVQAEAQYRSPQPQGPPPDRPAGESYPPPGDSRYGQVAIRVQPADAEVFIDGESWRTQAGAERLVVQLAAGTHRVEIRREGYDPFVTAVEIRRGETAVLNVSLSRF
jgi:hypothetical protein